MLGDELCDFPTLKLWEAANSIGLLFRLKRPVKLDDGDEVKEGILLLFTLFSKLLGDWLPPIRCLLTGLGL